ncbi:hypothetical protein FACS189475_10200 [Betaproteobacteria bacterium]|nr:hypothetical protein FACS189475_10200 [Betaproteobacteria bacterium]
MKFAASILPQALPGGGYTKHPSPREVARSAGGFFYGLPAVVKAVSGLKLHTARRHSPAQ